MATTTPDNTKRPWQREFWFWFLMAPLIGVVFVVAVLLTAAFRGADDVVIDNYYKQGRLINHTFEQDDRAQALGLTAALNFDTEVGEVVLTVNHREPLPAQLLLVMDHPARAQLDQRIVLQQISPGFYRGELELVPAHHWYLVLYPELDLSQRRMAPWRLSGEINFAETDRAQLKPRQTH